jgi:hypothetical protein
MRQLVIVAVVLASSQLMVASQLRREPLIVSAPFAAINLAQSPVELAPGTLNLGGRGVETLTLRLRTRRLATPLSEVIVRLAAGMFPDGMTTYRLRMAGSVPLPPQFTPSDDPLTWTMAIFERMREDPLPDLRLVGRDTTFVIGVEQARDTSGTVIYENPACRELLWKALGGS